MFLHVVPMKCSEVSSIAIQEPELKIIKDFLSTIELRCVFPYPICTYLKCINILYVYVHTVIWKIFVVKKFLWVAKSTKFYRTKLFYHK